MPGRQLPTILSHDVRSRNTSKSCFVTVGTKVYDITSFLDDHPGGGDLILGYGGKDVADVMGDEISHFHSEAAYEILDEYLIGFVANEKVMDAVTKSHRPDSIVPLPPDSQGLETMETLGLTGQENGKANGTANGDAIGSSHGAYSSKPPVFATTGMSSADDLSKETDLVDDFKTHKFLDLNRPLLMQIWNGGFEKDFYLEQVHRPRHYKGGASAPLFGNFLEPLSKTAWWVVPMVWLPPVAYGTFLAFMHIPNTLQMGAYWFLGLFLWTLTEYTLHRGLFHVDGYLPNNRAALTAHFLLHGIHHYLPMDKYRLVMPPTLFVALATPFYKLAHTVFYWDWYVAVGVFSGGIFGYICYDMTHYFLHHRNLPSYYRELKKYHLQHHFADYENGFGVTSRFWDRVFGTELAPPKVIKTS